MPFWEQLLKEMNNFIVRIIEMGKNKEEV
jgi:hypothetical protein